MRQVRLAAEAIKKARKPLIMAGHGIMLRAGPRISLGRLWRRPGFRLRTRCSVSAPFQSHPLGLGLMGMHGHKHVNDALDECDLLINIGARFDDRATGQVSGFAQNARRSRRYRPGGDREECADRRTRGRRRRRSAEAPDAEVEETRHDDWMAWIDSRRDRALDEALEERPAWPEPYTIIKSIAEATHGEAILTTDVGQHQMWAAQHFGFNYPDRWITSGGLGTMGFGLPSAIGAKIGRPDLEVWAVIGDGGFQMSLTSLPPRCRRTSTSTSRSSTTATSGWSVSGRTCSTPRTT